MPNETEQLFKKYVTFLKNRGESPCIHGPSWERNRVLGSSSDWRNVLHVLFASVLYLYLMILFVECTPCILKRFSIIRSDRATRLFTAFCMMQAH